MDEHMGEALDVLPRVKLTDHIVITYVEATPLPSELDDGSDEVEPATTGGDDTSIQTKLTHDDDLGEELGDGAAGRTRSKEPPELAKCVNEYRVVKKLGKGAYGSVKLGVKQDTQRCYALKSFNKRRLARIRDFRSIPGGEGLKVVSAIEKVKQEIVILSRLEEHENVCTLYEIMEDPKVEKLYIVLEYMGGGELMSYDPSRRLFRNSRRNNVLDADSALNFIYGASKGLHFLHSKGIIHRDIKPENLLLCGQWKRCVISDFGVATQLEESRREEGMLTGTQGTFAFFPPEACHGDGRPFSGYIADGWALMLCLHLSVFGKLPFYAEGMQPLFDVIKSPDVPYELPEPEELWQTFGEVAVESRENAALCKLLKECLDKDLSKRVSSLSEIQLGIENILVK